MPRTLTRWVAECLFDIELVSATKPRRCPWNDRSDESQRLHTTSEAAVREARDHAISAGHIGAREVTVRRVYKPREIASEEVVAE